MRDVEPLLARWGYPAIVAVVALDLTGVPMPAVAIMVAATVAAAKHQLSLPAVALVCFAAAVLGSQLGFALGRLGGRPLLARLPVAQSRVDAVERAYGRWGAWAVVLSPYLERLRQLNGLAAGLFCMPWWKFTLANLVGCGLWVAGWIGATVLVDRHVAVVLPFVRASAPWLLAATAMASSPCCSSTSGVGTARRGRRAGAADRRKEPSAAPRR